MTSTNKYRCENCGEEYESNIDESRFDYNLCGSQCIDDFFDLTKEFEELE